MANNIHPTAIIASSVRLGDNVLVGPYAVIEGEVTLADNVEVGAHATVSGWTKIGRGCRIFPHASIGTDPQDKKHRREDRTTLEVGENNIFREFVTVNRGTVDGGALTRIGDNNLFMAYSHVAHDCVVGHDCVLANLATLAGHVRIEDRVVIGGLTGLHQFVRIGKMAMIGGCSRVTQDVAPFALCNGNPALIYGVNAVGLKRAKVSVGDMKALKEAFRILFHSGLAKSNAVERIGTELAGSPELRHLLQFVTSSERGLVGGSVVVGGEGE